MDGSFGHHPPNEIFACRAAMMKRLMRQWMRRLGSCYPLVVAAWVTLGAPSASTARDGGVARDTQAAPGTEDTHDQLLKSSLSLAKSSDPREHAVLLSDLQKQAYLKQLDSEQDYAKASRFRLRVEQVIQALAQNPSPSARRAFLSLTHGKIFLADDDRRLALVRAGENIRPAPNELVAFWDRHSQANDAFTPTTIPVLITNGSEPALRLFEKKLADPARRQDEKVAWMRTSVLAHRNDFNLLVTCERMLQGSLPKKLRPFLVESLFDYRPGEWYRPSSSHSPPPLRDASGEALAVLARLGGMVEKNIPLTPAQREAVRRHLEEVRRLQQGGTGR